MQQDTPMRLVPAILALFACGPLAAADPVDAIALFDAIDAGQIEVKFIPADASKANVLVKNKTARMLWIKVPEAIAAVPVLAQFGQGPGQGLGQDGQDGGGGATQGVGGALNGGGQGNGRGNGFGNGLGRGQAGGPGMGFMRIAPDRTRKLTATTVCLEYGKPDPQPRIAYRMIPIEAFTKDAGVVQLCRQLGRGSVDQPTAQAVAWHLTSDLPWEKLAGINRMESRYFGNIKLFKRSELERAKAWVGTQQDKTRSTALSRHDVSARRSYSF
jgi:hypothetical protein